MLLKRKLSVLLAPAMLLASILTFSAPAFADKGGESHEGACGLGQAAHTAIEDSGEPGAKEYATIPPEEYGCTGQG